MDHINTIANEAEDKVKLYTHVVKELQASEDRNDETMKGLMKEIQLLY